MRLLQPRALKSSFKSGFWLNLCVGREFPILEILKYFSGWEFTSPLTLNQNPLLKGLFEEVVTADLTNAVVLAAHGML